MRAIALSAVLVCVFAAGLRADAESEVNNVVASLTAALTEVDVPEFMDAFDKNMPGYEQLKIGIAALVNQAEVSSSVETIKNEGNDAKRAVDLDWYLEVRSLVQDGPIVHRRELVHCELEKNKKRWKIVSIAPLDFFAPAKLAP